MKGVAQGAPGSACAPNRLCDERKVSAAGSDLGFDVQRLVYNDRDFRYLTLRNRALPFVHGLILRRV